MFSSTAAPRSMRDEIGAVRLCASERRASESVHRLTRRGAGARLTFRSFVRFRLCGLARRGPREALMDTRAPRSLVCWVPDWPVLAVGGDADAPAAVVDAAGSRARVVACSAAAREAGVRRGQRVRDAQQLSPRLAVHVRDEAAEARAFEPVAIAAESLAAGVEIVRPGLIALDARGPARYHGGEE